MLVLGVKNVTMWRGVLKMTEKITFNPKTCIHYYNELEMCCREPLAKKCTGPCEHYENVNGVLENE
jgi:hypothetical protein